MISQSKRINIIVLWGLLLFPLFLSSEITTAHHNDKPTNFNTGISKNFTLQDKTDFSEIFLTLNGFVQENNPNFHRGQNINATFYPRFIDNQSLIPNILLNYSLMTFDDQEIISGIINSSVQTFTQITDHIVLDVGEYSFEVICFIYYAQLDIFILLEEEIIFNVLVLPEPYINLKLNISSINTRPNQTHFIQLEVANYGGTKAYNLIFSNNINEPLGLTLAGNWTIEPILELDQGEKLSFNFSISPNSFGIGKISFQITYQDFLTTTRLSNEETLSVYIIPNLSITVQNQAEMYMNQQSKLNISIYNPEPQPLLISTVLLSKELNILSDTASIVYISANETFTTTYSVYPFQKGEASISLSIWLVDGADQTIIFSHTITETVLEQPSGESADLIDNYLSLFFILSIILLGVFVTLINFIYFRYKKQEYEKITQVSFTNGILRFPSTNKAVIDGSNVAWEETGSSGKAQVKNIFAVIEKLKESDFEEIITLADAALRYQVESQSTLDAAIKNGDIKLLPAGVEGDLFILRLAKSIGAMVISNDVFRQYREENSWISDKRIPFTIMGKKVFLHPPRLEEEEDEEKEEN